MGSYFPKAKPLRGTKRGILPETPGRQAHRTLTQAVLSVPWAG